MSYLVAAAALAIVWAAVSGSLTLPSLVFGFLVGWLVLLFVRGRLRGTGVLLRTARLLLLVLVFGRELVLGGLGVVRLTLLPRVRPRVPRIVAFPLSLKDELPIAVFANLVSLTPGTLSVDVSADRSTLFVHVLDAPDGDAAVRGLRDGLERRVRELWT